MRILHDPFKNWKPTIGIVVGRAAAWRRGDLVVCSGIWLRYSAEKILCDENAGSNEKAVRRAEWHDRGRISRSYVERWHNPGTIAKAMLAAYRSPDSVFDLNPDGPSPQAVSEFRG